MSFSFTAPTSLEYFRSLVQSDAQFPLLEAAISLAQDEYPNLDVQAVLGEVDQLLARLKRRIAPDAPPVHRLRMLTQYFYRDLGFGGNVNDYYDPDNSYVSVVLRNRRGIPISLAVLWLELAQGLGLAARGIGFPGHFLMKVNLPNGQVVIDPFSGQSLSREELSARIEPFYVSRGLAGRPDDIPLGQHLQVAPPREIIARMLRNLKEIHRNQEDWQRLVAVQDRLLILLPQAWEELRDRGLALVELGLARPALQDLETYLAQVRESQDRQAVLEQIAGLRRALG